MRNPGEAATMAGHAARWPILAYRMLLQHVASRPTFTRAALGLSAEQTGIKKSLVEDTICACENDGILIQAPLLHLTVAEQRRAPGERQRRDQRLRLTEKGRRFLAEHDQSADAGTCPCEWCRDLAGIRAWVAATPVEEQQRLLLRVIPANAYANGRELVLSEAVPSRFDRTPDVD